jgi:glycosyltransferase involved in cell wall biosynthesis
MVASIMGLKNSPDESEILTLLRVLMTTVGACRILVIAPAIDLALARLHVSRKRLVEMPVVGLKDFPSLDEAAADRSAVRRDLRLAPDDPVVMTVGNLEPRKSHELFVRAAALVSDEIPDAHFFVIGEGHLRPMLEAEVKATGMSSRIHLLGNRPDAARVIRAADVYVRPGVVEGFVGITVLEAQAAAVPVVAFETEDVKLAIEHGRTGLLVRGGDVVQMSEAIKLLLRDEGAATVIGRAGLEAVRESFSIDSITVSLERLYEKVARQG